MLDDIGQKLYEGVLSGKSPKQVILSALMELISPKQEAPQGVGLTPVSTYGNRPVPISTPIKDQLGESLFNLLTKPLAAQAQETLDQSKAYTKKLSDITKLKSKKKISREEIMKDLTERLKTAAKRNPLERSIGSYKYGY